jgi:hypothetical protein
VQQRFGADRLSVVLVDVDPEYYPEQKDYLPQANKILARHKLAWPNVLAPKGFHDVARAFNLSGYGNVLVDAEGVVRGVNLHGKELERVVEQVLAAEKGAKQSPQADP